MPCGLTEVCIHKGKSKDNEISKKLQQYKYYDRYLSFTTIQSQQKNIK